MFSIQFKTNSVLLGGQTTGSPKAYVTEINVSKSDYSLGGHN